MYQRLAHIALVVRVYDEAIDFYVNKLGFTLLEDTKLTEEKRWVMVAPAGAKECCLLLARAANEEQRKAIGNQTGGRVFLFLFTDNFQRDYERYLSEGVEFVRQPEDQPHGRVAVFADLYGNLWDLIEPAAGKNQGLLK